MKDSSCLSACTFSPFGICRCASLARRRRRRSRRARTSLPTLKKVEEEEGGGESPGGVSSGRQRSRNSCKQRRQKVETCQIQVLSFFFCAALHLLLSLLSCSNWKISLRSDMCAEKMCCMTDTPSALQHVNQQHTMFHVFLSFFIRASCSSS